ncbi:hypothetical protein C663_3997 [Bacillus subtilis XF-1]|nr:hypothetical protein C663_3997 [Bacillus subtilis XF-1]
MERGSFATASAIGDISIEVSKGQPRTALWFFLEEIRVNKGVVEYVDKRRYL